MDRNAREVRTNHAFLLECINPRGGIYPSPDLPDAREGVPEGFEVEEKNRSKASAARKKSKGGLRDQILSPPSVSHEKQKP